MTRRNSLVLYRVSGKSIGHLLQSLKLAVWSFQACYLTVALTAMAKRSPLPVLQQREKLRSLQYKIADTCFISLIEDMVVMELGLR